MTTITNMVNQSMVRALERVRADESLFPECTWASTVRDIRDAMDPVKPARGRYGARPDHHEWRPILHLLEEYGVAGIRSRTRIIKELNTLINESYYDSFWNEHKIGGFSVHGLEQFLRYGGGGYYHPVINDWRETKKEIRRNGSITGRVPFSVKNCIRAGIPRWMVRVLMSDAAHFDGGYTPKWVSVLPKDIAPLERFWNIRVTPVANIISAGGSTVGGTVFVDGELSITRYLTWD